MNKVLIIIDIQNDYFEGGKMALINPEAASLNARKLLIHFREKNMPVIHIQHLSTRKDASFFIPDTEGADIHANVKPLENEKVIIKHFPNSFRETKLLEYLKEKELNNIVVCGMMTHVCVDSTIRAAKDYNLNIELISDACATKNLEIKSEIIKASQVHKSFLAALNYFYSEVLTTNEYIMKN